VFRFGFLRVLSRIPLVVLGDPQGCPRQAATTKGVNDDLHHLKYLERAKSKVFEGASTSLVRILQLVKDEMALRTAACCIGELTAT
jgi:hypothetical protein